MLRTITLLLLGSLLSGGCATIINGTHEDIPVTSEPSGATVTVDGKHRFRTPTNLHLSRKHPHHLVIERRGYETQTVQVKPQMSAAVAGNIVAGGMIGWGVDATSGGQNKLVPSAVHVKLERARPAEVPPALGTTPAAVPPSVMRYQQTRALRELDELRRDGAITPDEYRYYRQQLLQQQSAPAPQPTAAAANP